METTEGMSSACVHKCTQLTAGCMGILAFD